MLKVLAVLALVAASTSACSFSRGAALPTTAPTSPAHATTVQRAVRDLQHARFGPWTSSKAPMLRDIQCRAFSTSRVRCHATWQGRETKPIVFGVKPDGALYVIVAGPLAIS